MRFKLPYNDGIFELDFPRRGEVEVVGDRFSPPIPDQGLAFQRALDQPVDSPPLRDLLPAEGRVSVLISDLTRGAGLGSILHYLLEYLEELGFGPKRVEIMLATGMHRGHSRRELEAHLGRDIVSRWRVLEHNAVDRDSLVRVGETPAGTPCLFNERIVDSGLIVVLGSISFHYFAGYGGARKLILPGIAGEETIISNHRLSLRDDPAGGLSDGCRPGNLEGNPVHEDMLAGAKLLPSPVFVINSVSDDKGGVLFLNSGSLEKSHRDACAFLWSNFRIPLERFYGAVIISAGGFP
ncbi:MAG: DUF2088 domain-containing protein, partial [Candidatus Krumholzibacteria bacterium]|nr:DUF2088 domain-containing protein [Candidatus Krumholzibacteria bacterium]